MKISTLFSIQKKYNKKIYGDKKLNGSHLENITQQLALCTHAEISSLISATQYKKHHSLQKNPLPDISRITYESVDAIRYLIAILNAWEISPERFEDAFVKKSTYLNTRKRIEENPWEGQKVAIVDMDDVIVSFRKGFSEWLAINHNVDANISSDKYYFIDALTKTGLNPEKTFLDFVSKGGFSKLSPVPNAIKFLEDLREKGYWIHILTARPEDNLQCMYDTYEWLSTNNVPFDNIDFSSEKFRWCANSEYYDSGLIKFAIDDSPKHAREYSSHGIKCLVPEKNYNQDVWDIENISTYKSFSEILKKQNL